METLIHREALDRMKTVSIVAMIFIHCLMFYSFFNKIEPLTDELSLINKLLLSLSIFSLCLPALAGAELRIRISGYLKNGRLIGFPTKEFGKLLVIIALIDPIKSSLSSGFFYGLRWDVLPLICFSIYFILRFLESFSLKSLALIVFPLIIFLEPQVINILKPFAITSKEAALQFSRSSSYFVPMFLALLVLILAGWSILTNIIFNQMKSRIIYFLKIALLSTFSYFFIKYWTGSPMYAAAIWNMPMASLVELKEIGGHIWPIFPWMGLVLAGFFYQHIILLEESKKNNMLDFGKWLFALAFLFFIIFLVKFFSFYHDLLSHQNYFTSGIFQGGWKLCIMVIIFYICFHFLTYKLTQKFFTRGVIFRLIGSGSLIIYAVHFVLAANIARMMSGFDLGEIGFLLYFIFITVISFAISGFIIYLYQSKIIIGYYKK